MGAFMRVRVQKEATLTKWTTVSRFFATRAAAVKVALTDTADVVRIFDIPYCSREST